MSDGDMKEGVYTTRVTGEMVDDLDEYIEDREQSKSAALRDLLDLGLQAEESGAEPAELQEEIDNLDEEREELQQQIDELLDQKLAGGLVTVGVLLVFAGSGLSDFGGEPLAGVMPQLALAVEFIAAMLMASGLVGWFWILSRPYFQPVYDQIRTVIGGRG